MLNEPAGVVTAFVESSSTVTDVPGTGVGVGCGGVPRAQRVRYSALLMLEVTGPTAVDTSVFTVSPSFRTTVKVVFDVDSGRLGIKIVVVVS